MAQSEDLKSGRLEAGVAGAAVLGAELPGRAGGFLNVQGLRAALSGRKKLWIALGALVGFLVFWRAMATGASAPTAQEALSLVLGEQGLRVQVDSVLWLNEDRGPLRLRGAAFLASHEGELADVYYADVRPGGEGQLLDVAWLSNLSHTGSAEEVQLIDGGDHFAFATRVGDSFDAVVLVDKRGEPESLTADWPLRARVQNSISNLQATGRSDGFGFRRYQLTDASASLRLSFDERQLRAAMDNGTLVLEMGEGEPVSGSELASLDPEDKGIPGTITWVVNSVRRLSFVGPEPIEWLEHHVFALKDRFNRAYHGMGGADDTAEEVAEEVADDLGMTDEPEVQARIAMLTATDPELGWPPPGLTPILTESDLAGEGVWLAVVDDPYVNAYPNAPPAFYQTFLRADPERAYTKVYITLWDPRQVQMRIQSGTREPESATGQRGAGMVPRDPETLRRLVGAFNGGFQSLHGEFGMMASNRVYLPPKPWAATVAVFEDGRVGMGSWPAPDWRGRYYDERLANRQIPERMVDMRQNLTSVVEDGEYNPWGRWYWGAAPRDAEEQTQTTRSAMCLTEEGFMAYFWSQGTGPEALGRSMLSTRCVRAVHLDMNNPHCGFEFFRPRAPALTPQQASADGSDDVGTIAAGPAVVGPLRGPLTPEWPTLRRRPREGSEYEGRFPRARGWHLRARRAVRSMAMPFPRYSGRDGRDFFYLTLRPVLPGPNLAIAADGTRLADGTSADAAESPEAGVFSTEGLPNAGWPHAFARTHLGEDHARTWVLRIDPRRAVPGPVMQNRQPSATAPHVLAHLVGVELPHNQQAAHGLWAHRHEVGVSYRTGGPAGDDRLILSGPHIDEAPDSLSAIGVDGEGFIVYVESASDSVALSRRLLEAGVEHAVALPPGGRLALEAAGTRYAGVDGYTQIETDLAAGLSFVAEPEAETEVLFPENEPLPYRRWSYLQDQRVRYFPSGAAPRFVRPENER